jgi:predicted dehydrogenase
MKSVKVALVGAGHLGTYHAEKLHKIENCELKFICDPNLEKTKMLGDKYNCKILARYQDCLNEVDAVLIAAPTPFHYEIATYFLENKKHVFIEKPMTETVKQAEHLCRLASDNNLVLQIGHVERFNPALVSAQKQLKKPLFIECHRLAPFKPRSTDVDVVLDLMIHDIDVVMSLVNSPVTHVSAVGTPVITKYVDIANARLEFESKAVANITASRVSQTATRKFRVFQETQYLSIDFGTGELNLTTKTGEWENFEEEMPLTFESWELKKADALMVEDQSFIDCIIKNQKPIVTGEQALIALKVAEQIRDEINRRLKDR